MSLQTNSITSPQEKVFPTSFKVRLRAIERIEKGEKLTKSMSIRVYKKYINSPEWQEKVKTYRKKNCDICGSKYNLHLHHLTYKNLLFETEEDFATLCKYCHQACHIGLVGGKKLRNPSMSIRRIVLRMRNGNKLKQEAFCLFLRRRWTAKHTYAEDAETPGLNFFREFYRKYIKDKTYPFAYQITVL